MITSCRSCGSSDLRVVLDLGSQPIANALLAEDDLRRPEKRYPLAVAFCTACAMLQVTETVPREVLYRRDYPYYSSASSPVLSHASRLVDDLTTSCALGSRSFVVEIGSNDGYLLRNFVWRGVPCLGIDPAEGPAERARERGVPTMPTFFGLDVARQVDRADLVIANNVLAHVDDINDFVAGIARLLMPTGTAVFEFAYAVDMVRRCEFDTIYHEHVFYHTITGLIPLFERHGLHVNDVEYLPIHGGSLRVKVNHWDWRSMLSVYNFLICEGEYGVPDGSFYDGFADRVEFLRYRIAELLIAEARAGRRIACYGAAAKGSTMLNYLDLGQEFFEFAVDATSSKQGKYTPGQHVPIFHPRELAALQPDDCLLLAWNFADEIVAKEASYRERGGRFIVPIPEPQIVLPDQTRSAA